MTTVSTTSVTVKDVARRAGVAVGTVSAALSGTGRISQECRERVRQVAREMGYQPKLAARLLRASSTGRLGLLLTDNESPQKASENGFTGPILMAFVAACERAGIGYHVEFLSQARYRDGEYPGPEQFRSGLVDGALVAGYIAPGPVRDWFTANADRHPWISLDEPGPLSVMHDTASGVRRAVEYLAAKRHRDIGYFGSEVDYKVYREGLKGFTEAVQTFGINTAGGAWIKLVDEKAGRALRIQNNIAAIDSLLNMPQRPTAIVCQSVLAARVVIHQAMRRGLLVPENLSVIGYGTESDAEKSLPRLDCIEPDHAEMVNKAVEMLRSKLRGEDVSQTLAIIPPQLVQRDSVLANG